MNPLSNHIEYQIIKTYYDDKTANRSGVLLMNHIDEGLKILDWINASIFAKKAYMIHPIFQSDEAIKEIDNYYGIIEKIDFRVLINVMEYRSVANEYLSKREIQTLSEIRLSPIKDVNDMLIADKIQNRKDFEIYHLGKHERSKELDLYFKNWLRKLNISEQMYGICKEKLTE